MNNKELQMEIPKTIRVGRTRYRILRPETLTGKRGDIFYAPGVIRVARFAANGAARRSPAAQAETFWHELTHAILHDIPHKLWCNEQFVTDFSKRLARAVRSAKF